jgi:hypothetical protein
LVAGSFRHFGRALRQIWEQRDFRRRIRPTLRAGVVERYGSDHVASKAIRVMQHALNHGEKPKLLDALNTDPDLKTSTSDAEVMQMLENTVGGPAPLDLLRMELRHTPLVHKAAHLYLEMTLYRRLRKQFAMPRVGV